MNKEEILVLDRNDLNTMDMNCPFVEITTNDFSKEIKNEIRLADNVVFREGNKTLIIKSRNVTFVYGNVYSL